MMTERRQDRVFLAATQLAHDWRRMLAEDDHVTVAIPHATDGTSDEVRDEHVRRGIDSAAAILLATELLVADTRRPVQVIAPVVDAAGRSGWAIRYLPTEEAA